jgi:leader peptidase (prepilin peptidase)/N-methyltransferase
MPPSGGWLSGFAVAVAAGLAGAVVAAFSLAPHQIIFSAFLAGTMGAIAVEDAHNMRVPDAWNFPAALGGFAASAWEAWAGDLSLLAALAHAALSGIVCGGVFYLLRELFFRLRKSEGLGFGDVKLAASGGIWVGWEVFPAVVTVAATVAILWIMAVAMIDRGWSRDRKIPFAVFLAPAVWVCWIYARSALYSP